MKRDKKGKIRKKEKQKVDGRWSSKAKIKENEKEEKNEHYERNKTRRGTRNINDKVDN